MTGFPENSVLPPTFVGPDGMTGSNDFQDNYHLHCLCCAYTLPPVWVRDRYAFTCLLPDCFWDMRAMKRGRKKLAGKKPPDWHKDTKWREGFPNEDIHIFGCKRDAWLIMGLSETLSPDGHYIHINCISCPITFSMCFSEKSSGIAIIELTSGRDNAT